jgi:hypothetical protein
MSGCQKALLGLAIGCGVLVLLGVIGGGITTWWFVRPGNQRPTEAVVSRQATGAFTVGDLGADPGVSALLDSFLLETQRQQQRDMPPWLRQMQQMGQAGSSPSAGLRMFLPRKATVSLEPSTTGSDQPAVVVALNPRGLTRLIDTIMSRGDSVEGEHRGHEVLRVGAGAWASVLEGTILIASEEPALRAGIDRMLAGGGAVAAAPAPDLGLPKRPWDLSGIVEGDDDELAHVLWGDEPPPQGVTQAHFGFDVATRDTAVGRVVVDCESPAVAEAAALALDRRALERSASLAGRGLALRATSRIDGSRAVLDWDLSGIDTALAGWIAEVEELDVETEELEPGLPETDSEEAETDNQDQ